MRISYNAEAISRIFAAMAEGRVTEDEFLGAQTPEEVDALLRKGGIDPDKAMRIMLGFTEVEGSLGDGTIRLKRNDDVSPR
jgi:hypothetical protein